MLTELKEALQLKKGIRFSKQTDLDNKTQKLKALLTILLSAEKARVIMQLVAKETQQQLEYKISELVTLGLSAIFDNPYELVLEYEIKRGKTEANILFKRDGGICRPMLASGGGAVDVAAFGLRVAIWSLKSPKSRNTIILDEPFRFLSKQHQERASQLLSEISKKLKLQIIMVTHNQEFIKSADRVFNVSKVNGISKVEVLR
jgi:DNA repair exonuclease SbcCD ATPase subunit